jgi:O-antigen ligase
LAAAMSAVMFFSYADVFLARTSPQARLEIKSINERRLYLQDSFSLIKKSNFLGVGIGNYSKALELAAPQRFYWQWQPVHNVFLLILAEGGIFALLSFGAFIISLFYLSCRQKNIFNLSILLSLGIIMMLDHYLWSLHSGQFLFWLAAGIVMRNFLNNKEYDN